MKNKRMFILLLTLAILSFSNWASAQPRVGDKISAFQLLDTGDNVRGINDGQGLVSVLLFVGYNWGTCQLAGPVFEEKINQLNKNKPGVQVLVLDVWNGNKLQAESYRQLTGVTAPILLRASNGTNYAGARLEDLLVVDQNRVVRLATNGVGAVQSYVKINQMVDALLNKDPVIAMSLRQLYFGTKMEVGQSKAISLDLNNTGEGTLDITGYQAPSGITMQPDKFTVAPGETKTVEITFIPAQSGTFTGAITFQHGNTNVGMLQIPILDLTIEGRQAPSIGLTQQNLDLGQSEIGQSVQKTFTITNTGPGILTISDIQSNLSDISLSTKQVTIASGSSKEITITFTPKTQGDFSGLVTVLSDDPKKSSIALNITGKAIFVPADSRADFDKSGSVDFPDFLSFVRVFGTVDTAFDLDGSGRVDFGDFLIFAKSFGKKISS